MPVGVRPIEEIGRLLDTAYDPPTVINPQTRGDLIVLLGYLEHLENTIHHARILVEKLCQERKRAPATGSTLAATIAHAVE
jgi:hypothetical protein